MNFKKRASQSIVLALVGITISTPILNSVSAMDVDTNNNNKVNFETKEDNDLYVNEELLLGNANQGRSISDYNTFYENVKEDFKRKFGTEDEFKVIASSKDFKTEGNGYTGQLKVTTYKNGEVDEVIFVNYLENVKNYVNQLLEEEKQQETYAESYVVKTIKSGGPDPLSFNVRTGGNYSSKYKMYATSWYGRSKTWYKNSEWKTGYTKGLYDELRFARNNVDKIASTLSAGVSKVEVLASLASFLGPVVPIPGISAVVGVLSAFSFSLPVIQVAGYSLDYIKNINVAQYNYNKI